MAAVAMTMSALALVVAHEGEAPEGAAAALQLSATAGFQWPTRQAALGHQAVLRLLRSTGWWAVGRLRVSFDAWLPHAPEAPPPRGTVSAFLEPAILNILFWGAAVVLWHRFDRPVVGSFELHAVADFPGGYSAVVLFEASLCRQPSEDGGSDHGSLPSTHSVFGTPEDEDVEVEVEADLEGQEEEATEDDYDDILEED
eukprot:s132_g17.t1